MKSKAIKGVLSYWLFVLAAFVIAMFLDVPMDNRNVFIIIASATFVYFIISFAIKVKQRKKNY